MNWLIRLFATYRELRRLAAEVKYLRGQVSSLEADNKMMAAIMARRDAKWADRFLTSIVKTYPIAQEAISEAIPPDNSTEYAQKLTSYLLERKLELEQDAVEASLPIEEAHRKYQEQEPFYKQEFADMFGFN